jgi:chromosomal replication initiation ATPase DnaA
MNYKDYKNSRAGAIISAVREIIEIERINTKNRSHHKVHKRFFLMWYLRENTEMSLDAIGGLFNKDHATVLHGIKKHYEFTEYNDSVYLINHEGIKQFLNKKFKR